MSRSTLVFDGDCGFCTWSVDVARKWIRPRAKIVPWQRADLAVLGLTEDECQQAIQWVTASGERYAGGRAVAALLRNSPAPWPVIAVMADLPGLAQIVDAGYRLVAANRYRLPGATPACRLPVAPDLAAG